MLLEYSESMMRRFISSLPDGDYTGIDHLDDDGIVDSPAKVQVNVHIRGDRMLVDFDGKQPPDQGKCQQPLVLHPGRGLLHHGGDRRSADGAQLRCFSSH